MGLAKEKVIINIQEYGNTVAATIRVSALASINYL
ncbi:MAG: hypothetical protein CSA36_00575 [Draconibacterium sp.]|nr:MAG: hypothetical protein CSA36_00575 [Draconibacterium sp.]